jgi:hypothetical protein
VTKKAKGLLEEESTGEGGKTWREIGETGEREREIRSVSGVSKRRRDSGRQIQYVTRGETTIVITVSGWPDTRWAKRVGPGQPHRARYNTVTLHDRAL